MSAEPGLAADAAGPVTTTVTRRVKPGHEPLYEQFLTFACGGDSRLVVTQHHRNHRGGDQGVLAGGRPGRRVAWLRARGVQLQDLPELDTVDGVADLGLALAAWFTNPHHNRISPLQLK